MIDCPKTEYGVHRWITSDSDPDFRYCDECGQMANGHQAEKLTGASNADFDPAIEAIREQFKEFKALVTSPTGGQKEDKEARFDLIPVEALWGLAEIYGRGAKKYSKHNWRKGYDWSLSYAAAQRHMQKFWQGEEIDPESNQPHVLHAVFHMFTLFIFGIEQREFDDRYAGETRTGFTQGHLDFGGVQEGSEDSAQVRED